MENSVRVLGVELLVDDLDRAVELFVDVLGLELSSRGVAAMVDGEMAVVSDGAIAITLLAAAPAIDDPRRVHEPRLTQIVLAAADADGRRATALAAGLGVADLDLDVGFFVTPESAEGALGQPVAVVVTSAEG